MGWHFIVRNPLAAGPLGRLNGLEGLDVEDRGGRWREADDAFSVTTETDVGNRFHVEELPERAFPRVLVTRGAARSATAKRRPPQATLPKHQFAGGARRHSRF